MNDLYLIINVFAQSEHIKSLFVTPEDRSIGVCLTITQNPLFSSEVSGLCTTAQVHKVLFFQRVIRQIFRRTCREGVEGWGGSGSNNLAPNQQDEKPYPRCPVARWDTQSYSRQRRNRELRQTILQLQKSHRFGLINNKYSRNKTISRQTFVATNTQ